jgi:hypothetical protein
MEALLHFSNIARFAGAFPWALAEGRQHFLENILKVGVKGIGDRGIIRHDTQGCQFLCQFGWEWFSAGVLQHVFRKFSLFDRVYLSLQDIVELALIVQTAGFFEPACR